MSRALLATSLLLALAFPAGAQEDPFTAQPTPEEEEALEAATRRVLELLAPSVVEVEALGGIPEAFEAPESQEEAEQQGGVLAKAGFKQAWGPSTGLVVREDGLILTSTFVLSRDPRHLFVTLADGRSFVARVLGRDESRALALLKVEAEDLPVPRFAEADDFAVGRFAVTLGRGLGAELPSLSRGIISALERVGGRALQSSAAISPVNYGGPICSLEGEVLGLLVPLSTSGGMASVEIYDSGIGFAIPAPDLLKLLPRLEAGETLAAGFLGVVPDPRARGGGVLVGEVAPDSPAAEAGLQAGDVILALDGAATGLAWQLKRALAGRFAGDAVVLRVRRGAKEWDTRVTLAGPPSGAPH